MRVKMKLHTIEEVAALLRKSVGTIYNYSTNKKFSHLVPPKASRKGEKVLFKNVDEWMQERFNSSVGTFAPSTQKRGRPSHASRLNTQ